MSGRSPSNIVLSTSEHYPRVGSVLTWLWAQSYLASPRDVHWLFRELRQRHPVDVSRRVRLRTGEWCIVDPFDFIGGEIAAHGYYEQETIEFFAGTLDPGMVVLDVGAHVGQYALIASTIVGAEGHVYAFEPEPRNHGRLRQNVRLNRRSNVTCLNAAVSDRATRLEFNVSRGNSGGHSLGKTKYSGGRTITVEATTADAFVEAHALSRVDLLKADVEGAELLVVRGAADTIARWRPLMVLECSIHSRAFGYEADDLVRCVRSLGYEILLLEEGGLRPSRGRLPAKECFNIACIPSERAREVLARLDERRAAQRVEPRVGGTGRAR